MTARQALDSLANGEKLTANVIARVPDEVKEYIARRGESLCIRQGLALILAARVNGSQGKHRHTRLYRLLSEVVERCPDDVLSRLERFLSGLAEAYADGRVDIHEVPICTGPAAEHVDAVLKEVSK